MAELVAELVDVVSKNGNLLLNFTPDPEGAFNAEHARALTEIGRWLATNGEAIYGTRPWKVFGEGPHEGLGSNFKMPRPVFEAADVRFTAKGDTVFAIPLAWPADRRLAIKALGAGASAQPGVVKSVALLGEAGAIAWKQTAEALEVTLPSHRPTDYARCYG